MLNPRYVVPTSYLNTAGDFAFLHHLCIASMLAKAGVSILIRTSRVVASAFAGAGNPYTQKVGNTMVSD